MTLPTHLHHLRFNFNLFQNSTMSKQVESTDNQVGSLPKQPLTLYTTQTPNGIKISIILEELGIPYKVHKHDFVARTQKEPWYLEINPNGRIPAIVDTFSDNKPIYLWESGSIMKYLVEQYDHDFKLWFPPGTRENYELFSWVSWVYIYIVSSSLTVAAILPDRWPWAHAGPDDPLQPARTRKDSLRH